MRSGILIIGSLLWDDGRDGKRKRWREERLLLEKMTFVQAPIRYGRRSESRANTYSMCFDAHIDPGEAALVPCIAPVNNLTELIDEAEALWRVEDHTTDRRRGICATWGAVGALFRDKCLRNALVTGWAERFRAVGRIVPPINDRGVLDIMWPRKISDGSPVDFDVILATATVAQHHWPTVSEIALSWVNQSDGHERYFIENIRHGIRTIHDAAILNEIRRASPPWADNEVLISTWRSLPLQGSTAAPPGPSCQRKLVD